MYNEEHKEILSISEKWCETKLSSLFKIEKFKATDKGCDYIFQALALMQQELIDLQQAIRKAN